MPSMTPPNKVLVGLTSFIAAFVSVLVMVGSKPESAEAHKSGNCRHGNYTWVFYQDGAHPIYYKEAFAYMWGAGPHYHTVNVFSHPAGDNHWYYIHTHEGRICDIHPV